MPKKVQLSKEQVEVVDGVRAVAVLLVIALHWKNVFAGAGGLVAVLTTPGAGGVIIFFVVSGLCITLSKKPGESWISFYVRRAFRLLPALWFSLAVYLSILRFGWGKTVSIHDMVSSFLVVPNWFGAGSIAGWNGLASELNPVLWSLQTEIELYLLFPLSLWLFRLFPKRTFLTLTLSVTVAAWVAWLTLQKGFNYFPPFPAICHWFIWNLGLYLCFEYDENVPSKSSSLAFGITGLAMGAGLLLLRNQYHSNLLSFWYFFSGLGTYYFLEWALTSRPMWLRNSFIGIIGKRSYSYYLNHWPVAIIGSVLFNSKLAAALFGLVTLVAFGEISYRLVELPFIRFGKSLAAQLGPARVAFLSREAKPRSSANA